MRGIIPVEFLESEPITIPINSTGSSVTSNDDIQANSPNSEKICL